MMLPRVKACPLVGAGLYSDLPTSPWKPGVVLKSAPWSLKPLKFFLIFLVLVLNKMFSFYNIFVQTKTDRLSNLKKIK